MKELQENPYLQYFIGFTEFRKTVPFTSPAMVSFRKRIDVEFLALVNDMILEDSDPTSEHNGKNENDRAWKVSKASDVNRNMGTAILDTTISPSNIRYSQDFSLLNEASEKLEAIIDRLHRS